MTLLRQLILFISIMFVLVFAGTFSLTIDNTRRYLNTQLGSHAQDTATSLALSLTPHATSGDVLLMKSMVDAVFDRGEYRSITVDDLQGVPLISRQIPLQVYGVPQWFMGMVPLETPEASAKLMAGWRQAGSLRVTSHPGHAYDQLWTNAVETFWWSLGALLLTVTLSFLALRLVLRSLTAVEKQALAIAQREFPKIKEIPRSRELRRVVTAMNTMAEKVEALVSEHHEQSEHLRNAAFKDALTGLGNQRAFERDIARMATRIDEHAYGVVGLLRLLGLDEANHTEGYHLGDRLLEQAGDCLRRLVVEKHGSASRLGGGLFGIVMPDVPRSAVEEYVAPLMVELESLSVGQLAPAGANLGMAYYGGSQTAEVLTERALNSLQNAQSDGANVWHMYDDAETAAGRDIYLEENWREILARVVDRKEVVLTGQPVKSSDLGSTLQTEIFARIRDEAGELVSAGVFFPVAARIGLAEALDRCIVEATMDLALKPESGAQRYAVNLSRNAVQSEVFVDWLADALTRHEKVAGRLTFEITESMVVGNPDAALELVRRLRAAGTHFGVDHCGARDLALDYLRRLKVDYIKVDGSLIRGLDREDDRRNYVRSLIATARALDIQIIAEHIENVAELDVARRLDFDGYQGYFIGRPGPV